MNTRNDYENVCSVRYEENTGRRGGESFYIPMITCVSRDAAIMGHARDLAKKWAKSRASEHVLPRVTVSYYVTFPGGKKSSNKVVQVDLK